jgi:hypothetical protein
MARLSISHLDQTLKFERRHNIFNAWRHPTQIVLGNRAWNDHARAISELKIKAGIHFSLPADQPEELPFHQFLSVLSARAHYPTLPLVIHVAEEPKGKYGKWLQEHALILRYPAFGGFGPALLEKSEIRSFLARLIGLRASGGLALDMDTLTLAARPLFDRDVTAFGILPHVPQHPGGASHKAIWAGRHSTFIAKWIKAFESFNGRSHSVDAECLYRVFPLFQYVLNVEHAKIIAPQTCCLPSPPQAKRVLFGEDNPEKGRRSFESASVLLADRTSLSTELSSLASSDIASGRNLFCILAREQLALLSPQLTKSLPDDLRSTLI